MSNLVDLTNSDDEEPAVPPRNDDPIGVDWSADVVDLVDDDDTDDEQQKQKEQQQQKEPPSLKPPPMQTHPKKILAAQKKRKRQRDAAAAVIDLVDSSSSDDDEDCASVASVTVTTVTAANDSEEQPPPPTSIASSTGTAHFQLPPSFRPTKQKKKRNQKQKPSAKKKAVQPETAFIMIDSSDDEEETPMNMARKRNTQARRVSKKPAGSNTATRSNSYEPAFQSERDYNYNISQEAAMEMQERMFREAAERVRSLPPELPVIHAMFTEPVFDIAERYPNHWQWSKNDPHACLGLPPNSSMQLIKSQYRKLARRYHPDMCREREVDKFHGIAQAYRKLTQQQRDE
jgi:DnaJ-domain-containing protein 1